MQIPIVAGAALITYVEEEDYHPSVTCPVDWLPSLTDNKFAHIHTHTHYHHQKVIYFKMKRTYEAK